MEKSCGVIILKDGKVLLVAQNNGNVCFPKGHVEKGETEEETAIREVFEETNLRVKVDSSKRYTISYKLENGNIKEVVYFIGSYVSGELKKLDDEIHDAFWVDKDKVPNYLTYSDIKDMYNSIDFNF